MAVYHYWDNGNNMPKEGEQALCGFVARIGPKPADDGKVEYCRDCLVEADNRSIRIVRSVVPKGFQKEALPKDLPVIR